MTTARDLVTDSAFKSTVYGQAQAMQDADAQLMLRELNRMLGLWSNELLMQYNVPRQVLPLQAGVQSYPSSLLPAGRPVVVDYVSIEQSGVTYECKVIDRQTWDNIAYKATSGLPNQVFIDTGFPDTFFRFYPVPSAPSYSAIVDATYRIGTTPLTLDTLILLPEGYEGAIVDNLAVRIAPSFGKEAPASVQQSALEARATLARTNHIPLVSDTETPISSGLFNIYRGS